MVFRENHPKPAWDLNLCGHLSSSALFGRLYRRDNHGINDLAKSPSSRQIHENHQINHNHQIRDTTWVIFERHALRFLPLALALRMRKSTEKLRQRRLSHSLSSEYSKGLRLGGAVVAAQGKESAYRDLIFSTTIGEGVAFPSSVQASRKEGTLFALPPRQPHGRKSTSGRAGTESSKCKLIMTCRIERFVTEEDHIVLRISGQIRERNVDLLRGFLERETKAVALDLKDVVLVDRETVTLLALHESNGTELRNCPSYIREWVTRERGTRIRRSKK